MISHAVSTWTWVFRFLRAATRVLACSYRASASLLFLTALTLPVCGTSDAAPPNEGSTQEIVLVVGAPGESSYESGFTSAAQAWREAAQRAHAHLTEIGLDTPADDAPSDRAKVQQALAGLDAQSPAPVWIIYLGHGTFDRKQIWWNLRGPDLSGDELVQSLKSLGDRTVIVVHGGSASGPLIPLLSGPHRIIVTATRSGDEVNYARFGERFAHAIASPRADLDQDGTTSLLEAFLLAAKETQALYIENNRMATEHALIDDNGDKLGTPPDWFQGIRVVKRPDGKNVAADGFRAHQITLIEAPDAPVLTVEQRQERDDLERELETIRSRRASLAEADYLNELERVLRKLAALYMEKK